MSKWALDQTYKMIIAADECEIKFRPIPGFFGLIIGNLIKVDHTRGDWFGTIVHELFHYLYPTLTEAKIRSKTKRYIKESSWPNKAALTQELLNSLN